MDRAEQMREAAALVAEHQDHDWHDGISADYNPYTKDELVAQIAAAIRALPLPPQPPLADDVAGVVQFIRKWEAFRRDRGGFFDADKFAAAADLIERLARDKAEVVAAVWEAEGKLSDATARAEKAEADLLTVCQREADTQRRHDARLEALDAEVARLRDGHLQIIREFGDTPNGHRAAEISRAALTPKGADHE